MSTTFGGQSVFCILQILLLFLYFHEVFHHLAVWRAFHQCTSAAIHQRITNSGNCIRGRHFSFFAMPCRQKRQHSISKRYDHVKVIIWHLPGYSPVAFLSNLSEFPTGWFFVQFSFFIDMLNMLNNIGSWSLKLLGHSDRTPIRPWIQNLMIYVLSCTGTPRRSRIGANTYWNIMNFLYNSFRPLCHMLQKTLVDRNASSILAAVAEYLLSDLFIVTSADFFDQFHDLKNIFLFSLFLQLFIDRIIHLMILLYMISRSSWTTRTTGYVGLTICLS